MGAGPSGIDDDCIGEVEKIIILTGDRWR